MRITDALSIYNYICPVVSFTGGGGKSTSIYRLASELSSEGMKVLVTTTTMIFHPDVKNRPYHRLITGDKELFSFTPKEGTITVAAESLISEKEKLKGFRPEIIDRIKQSRTYSAVLVEADGARGRPVKAPAEYEPVIPESTDITAGVIGAECLGFRITPELVHRMDFFCGVTNTIPGERITPEIIKRLADSDQGLFKGTSQKCKRFVILNKSDTFSRISMAEKTASKLASSGKLEGILIAAAEGDDPVLKAIHSSGRETADGNI